MGVLKDNTRSQEDAISTPLPGETLAMFYARSREFTPSLFTAKFMIHIITGEYWAQKAHQSSDNRGKMLRRDGFALAQERYSESIAII